MKKVAAVLVLLVGCGTASSNGPDESASAISSPTVAQRTLVAPANAASDQNVIAVIATRDRRIELRAGSRVTVKTVGGDVIASNVAIEDLKDVDPFLYDLCRSSFAGAGAGTFVDARLEHSAVLSD